MLENLYTCTYQIRFESQPNPNFACREEAAEEFGRCIFHDRENYEKFESQAADRFKKKVSESIESGEPLQCVGYFLPYFIFNWLAGKKPFEQQVDFRDATFYKNADFSNTTFLKDANFYLAKFLKDAYFQGAKFSEGANFESATFSEMGAYNEAKFCKLANFSRSTFRKNAIFAKATFSEGANFESATFSGESADFEEAKLLKYANFVRARFIEGASFLENDFSCKTFFRKTIFEQPNKVVIDDNDLSKVSFADTDIAKIRLGDKIKWGEGKERFTIIEEKWLKQKIDRKNDVKNLEKYEDVNLEGVLAVYRNLRENYESRLRYDDAGEFFIKEMELKRNYRRISSKYAKIIALYKRLKKRDKNSLPKVGDLIENGWFIRHFSLIGLYYHLSNYGESIKKPAITGIIVLALSTIFFSMQSNLTLEPSLPFIPSDNSTTSTFVGVEQAGNTTHWFEAFERSFADFLPLLAIGGDIKLDIVDYIIKIVGSVLSFGLLAIALRRKLERKYTR